MYCQLRVANGVTLRSGCRRIPSRASIRFSSTGSSANGVHPHFQNVSRDAVSEPNTSTTTSTPSSLNSLEASLELWSQKVGQTATDLIGGETSKRTFSRGKKSSIALETLKSVPQADAEGELCVVQEGPGFKTLRRLPGTNSSFRHEPLKIKEEGGLYLVNEGKAERKFIPLPSKSAADAIQEVRRRDVTRFYGHSEVLLQPKGNSPLSSRSGTSRTFSTSRSVRATLDSLALGDLESLSQTLNHKLDSEIKNKQDRLELREQLKAWDEANPKIKLKTFEDGNVSMHSRIEASLLGNLTNDQQRLADGNSENTQDPADDMLFRREDVLDVGDRRSFLVRGDMVELKFGHGSELAIYIQNRGDLYGFYTLSGRWLQWPVVNSGFTVPNFIKRKKLEPLVQFITNADESTELIPRHIGAPLIEKMQSFWENSNRLYRAHASRFNKAYRLCAHEKAPRRASLLEIADEVIPAKFKDNGKFPASVLFALYRAIDTDKLGFQPALINREKYAQFKITSLEEINTISFVRDEVRKYLDTKFPTPELPLVQFITKAQNLIHQSRKWRDVTKHGVLGPLKPGVQADNSSALAESYFSENDLRFVRFFESWCCRRTFDSKSPDSAIGSVILGATKGYPEMELDQSTGWVFLQELGILSPAANPAAFLLDLPLAGGLLPDGFGPEEQHDIGSDALDGLRKDWGDLPIYCIDDVGAHEIDDGISIEPAGQPGEYWVHIHTANPGSEIAPGSELGKRSEAMAGTSYLPEKVIRMLPENLVQERFSLASGRPSITYSARLNQEGEILEQLATPGTLRNVLYITPQVVQEAIQGHPTEAFEPRIIAVGDDARITDTPEPRPTRPIASIGQLSTQDRHNLGLLYALSVARVKRGMERGSFTDDMRITLFGNGQSKKPVQISTTFISERGHVSSDDRRLKPDPRIEMRMSGVDSTTPSGRDKADCLVKNCMLMGGEIAGRWCLERGIPVIYRVSQRNDDLVDPADFYRREIQPRILASEQIPLEILKGYLNMVGNIQPSSTPGPHLSLGMDMFTRSTSPLRRYGDLLLQWQVQAGFLEEARLGSSLIGSKEDSYLPFPKSAVDQMIPGVKTKEFELMLTSGIAEQYWCIQFLIRAWKFKEAPLPKTFEFVIKEFRSGYILGHLPYFGGLSVRLNYPKWMRPEDVKLDDAFEVEIVDLNAYNRQIHVNALRPIGSSLDLAT